MKANLYTYVGVYSRGLDTLAHILAKGAEFAAAKGVSEAAMLDWRLADDMFPLRRQAQVVVDFSRQWPARAAGLDVPAALEGEPGLAELQPPSPRPRPISPRSSLRSSRAATRSR